jgi:hypothetical protein
MSTLRKHTGNGHPTATSLQPKDTKEQIDGILQQFDVLPSRFDRFLFKYSYVYLLGLFVPGELFIIIYSLSRSPQVVGVFLQGVGLSALPMLAFILGIWRFNVWRVRTQKTLRDLWEHKRIAVPDSDASTSYLRFLEHYRDALASPKRYFLSGFLMIVFGILFAYDIVLSLSSERPNFLVAIQGVGSLLYLFSYLGGFYCVGIMTWAMYISGGYVRKLVRAFQLNIQPFHPDQCGGLKLLGNFCFGLVSPLLMPSGLLIGYSMFTLWEYSPAIYGEISHLLLTVGFPLLFVLLYALPGIVFVFMLPLRAIHTKMVSEAKTNESSYFMRTEALREEIQALLAVNQVEAAKAVQEEKALVETLYCPYPTWPFPVRSKISKTVFEVSVSLLVGVFAAAVVQYFFPAILTLLFHTP